MEKTKLYASSSCVLDPFILRPLHRRANDTQPTAGAAPRKKKKRKKTFRTFSHKFPVFREPRLPSELIASDPAPCTTNTSSLITCNNDPNKPQRVPPTSFAHRTARRLATETRGSRILIPVFGIPYPRYKPCHQLHPTTELLSWSGAWMRGQRRTIARVIRRIPSPSRCFLARWEGTRMRGSEAPPPPFLPTQPSRGLRWA